MDETAVDGWSPADNPYAIAVSEAQWALRDVELCVGRIHAGGEVVSGFDSRQIDARHLCLALAQLLTAETLEQEALADLGMHPEVGRALGQARKRFELALPNIARIRNGLVHFESWSRGLGYGPQSQQVEAGDERRDVARVFWGFRYDVTTDAVSMGPYQVNVTAAGEAAAELANSIYMAARAIDTKDTADHRDAAAQVLTDAEVSCTPAGPVQVSVGFDGRVWLSLGSAAAAEEAERHTVARRAISALTGAGFGITSLGHLQADDLALQLAAGQALRIEPRAALQAPAPGPHD
ncbi:hypothetical protein C8K30_1172 [Promicromonospora sp. AC04]|uniref:hypothetical protein n=1 Tax=Promicromonospora sp. AC04 TaxID=2135723 RepID=UPI000D3CC66E|nr:hypothetical protein [Promicromonospora sp. AC04]PUB20177.1 hypothetical protein C8K30_1172 [Promicromonospora sp. AC04]